MHRFHHRTTVAAALAAAVAVALVGCSSTTPSGSGGFQTKSPLKIGYTAQDLANPYWQNYEAGVRAEAKKEGVQVVVADAKASQQTQVSGSQNLINQAISALIVSPVEPTAIPGTANAAHRARIPLVVGDVGATGKYDAFVQSDNRAGGALAADYMAKKFGDADTDIGVIELHPGSTVGVDRVGGFKDRLKKYPNIHIVSSLNGNDAIKEGHDAAANALSAHPSIKGFYAANDNEAQGAIAAIQEAGKDPKDFTIVGFDGNAGSISAIGDGTQTATVAQDPYGQGQLCVQVALDLVRGKKVDYTTASKKLIQLKVQLVDKDNLDQFTKDRAGQK